MGLAILSTILKDKHLAKYFTYLGVNCLKYLGIKT